MKKSKYKGKVPLPIEKLVFRDDVRRIDVKMTLT